MVRVTDLDASLAFYCDKLGLVEASRTENAARAKSLTNADPDPRIPAQRPPTD